MRRTRQLHQHELPLQRAFRTIRNLGMSATSEGVLHDGRYFLTVDWEYQLIEDEILELQSQGMLYDLKRYVKKRDEERRNSP